MKDLLDLINDEPELQAAVRSTEQACNSAADAFRSFADTCRLVRLWCDKDNTDSLAESAQRRQMRRESILRS